MDIKKRILHIINIKNLIVCVCVFFALVLSQSLFLSGKIFVSANVNTEKGFQAQVFYAAERGDVMDEAHSVRQQIPAGKSVMNIELPVQHLYKVRFDFGSKPGRVALINFAVVGNKRVKLDAVKFKHFNETVQATGKTNEIVIVSNESDPYMVCQEVLDINGGISVNWLTLIILFCLYWFIIYKTVNYLYSINKNKEYSWSDLIFVAIFFAMLFVPMMHISDATKSDVENRMLATKPQLISDGWINNNFSAKFNDWFGDHFLGRDVALSLYKNIKYSIAPNAGNEKVLVGKDGWLFYRLDNSSNNYANQRELSEQQLKNSLKYLTDFNDWCKKNKKEFYVFIAPDKNKIYGEYFRLVNKQRSDEYSIGHQVYNYVRNNSDVKIVYPYDELMKNKDKGYLYYKQDTHWTDLGAYIGYIELTKTMGISPLDAKYQEKTRPGDLYQMYPLTLDTIKYPHNNSDAGKFCDTSIGNPKAKCTMRKSGKNVWIIKDSFMTSLGYYLVPHFKNMYFNLWGAFTKEDLDFIKNNADIIIIEVVERNVSRFNREFPNN